MNKDIKADLSRLMGGDDKLTEEAEAQIDTRNRSIEEAGLITRAETEAPAETADPTPPPPNPSPSNSMTPPWRPSPAPWKTASNSRP
jgi:hypothetical protein